MAPELAGLGKGVIRSLVSFSSLHFPRPGCEVMLTGMSLRELVRRDFSLCLICILGKQNIRRGDRHAF